ncbi:MAG: type IX secretion system membrane protein PorP/SprF [Bacteroidales bacterium]|nr:type IX secretion system membrane protein PorP/SprF [Bacteroidales bacterium]
MIVIRFKNTLRCLIILFISVNFSSYGQQDPMYAQYMFNTLAINPAYAGSQNYLSALLLSRHQWVGFEGAPSTQNLTIHSPIRNQKSAFGFSYVHDKIGPTTQNIVYVDYAYKIKFSESVFLSLGLRGGASVYNIDFTDVKTDQQEITPTANKISSDILPNFGGGVFLQSEGFYLGISVPKILKNKLNSGYIDSAGNGYLERHYFLISGLIFSLSETVKFKPTTLIKYVNGTPISIDVSANMLFNEKLWVGVLYKIQDAIGVNFQYVFDNSLKFGYAVDFSLSPIRSHSKGSHEFVIGFNFNFKQNKIISPRYF